MGLSTPKPVSTLARCCWPSLFISHPETKGRKREGAYVHMHSSLFFIKWDALDVSTRYRVHHWASLYESMQGKGGGRDTIRGPPLINERRGKHVILEEYGKEWIWDHAIIHGPTIMDENIMGRFSCLPFPKG
ncbi:unnamed protein product [Cuscuta campestris]|uniref:Uncharacterized protein n=1 Tax=Cuscuta campestris TaxID=132261 RepID=A0A484NIE9_9ASTE|nr:unnamed protein product [Cuscuta campestris]